MTSCARLLELAPIAVSVLQDAVCFDLHGVVSNVDDLIAGIGLSYASLLRLSS